MAFRRAIREKRKAVKPALRFGIHGRGDWTPLELTPDDYRKYFRAAPPPHIREFLAIIEDVA